MTIHSNPYQKSATGLEIKDWIWYNSHNKTRYTKMAQGLISLFNLQDDKVYMIVQCYGKPTIVEVEERNKHYEIPCDN